MLKNLIYLLKRPYHFIKTGLLKGIPSQIKSKFANKKMKIIVITGTDGKTTSATLLYHLLKTAGKKVGLITTVAAYIGDEKIETGLHVTAPGPRKLYRFIKQMVERNFEYLVLEFTSHGAYQFRNWGIKPMISAVTNVDMEHLDYHLNYDQYIKAKTLLLKNVPTVVLNRDDRSFHKFKKLLKPKQKIIEYSQDEKLANSITTAMKKRFPEKYNQMNSRLVLKILEQLGIKDQKIITQGFASFPGVPGRMEYIPNKRGFEVVVDFAHTSQGIEATLTALRQKLNKKKGEHNLIAVYGCAGLRDRDKRPLMGKFGAAIADLAIFTTDDNRTEDIWSIIRQMKEQLTEDHRKIVSIPDRRKAIAFAFKQAKKGDIVALMGKGPEQSLAIGKQEIPWSDKKVALELLNK